MKRVALALSLVIASGSALGSVHFGETTTEVKLRAQPTTRSWSPETLARGTKLVVIDRDGVWCRVRVHVRVTGTDLIAWVHSDYIVLGPAHSRIVVHNAVLGAIPGFAPSLAQARVPIAEWVGDRYDIFDKLIIAFGRGSSLEDLKATINSIGPDPNVYIAPVADENMNEAIIVGANVGYDQRVASAKDLYNALDGVADTTALADSIYAKGKTIKP